MSISQKTANLKKPLDISGGRVYNTTHTAESCVSALISESVYLRLDVLNSIFKILSGCIITADVSRKLKVLTGKVSLRADVFCRADN